MKRELTEHQRRCVNAILANVQEYLELRHQMTAEVNPRVQNVWPMLQFLMVEQLRNTLSNDKAWGATRYVIGEVLCSPDRQKISDIFLPTNQVSIMNEIVEKKAEASHKTSDVLEIHDFRTMYAAIDPSVAQMSTVMQICIWWDLKDAADLAKFQIKVRRIKELQAGTWSPEMARAYAPVFKRKEDEPPVSRMEVLEFEFNDLKYVVEQFNARRQAEPAYRIVLGHKPAPADDGSDRLIQAIAREQILIHELESGGRIDGPVREQLARGMNVAPDAVAPDAALAYLKGAVGEQKQRLKKALAEGRRGEPYNYKVAQADTMQRIYGEIAAGHAALDLNAAVSSPENQKA